MRRDSGHRRADARTMAEADVHRGSARSKKNAVSLAAGGEREGGRESGREGGMEGEREGEMRFPQFCGDRAAAAGVSSSRLLHRLRASQMFAATVNMQMLQGLGFIERRSV